MLKSKKMPPPRTILSDISESEAAAVREQWEYYERQTERTLSLLDDWIKLREQICRDWDATGLGSEHQREVSDCLNHLNRVREYRGRVDKHQINWALSLLTVAVTAEHLMDLRIAAPRRLQQRLSAFKRKAVVQNRRNWLMSHIEDLGLTRDEIEGSRNVRKHELYPEYKKKFDATMRTLNSDLSHLGYDTR